MKKMLLWLALSAQVVLAQVPKVGQAGKTEIACWNVEWFGSTSFGPTDETLQYNNIKNAITSADLDIIGLEEVSNITTFTNLMAELPQYGYVLASYTQTQKTALIWKKSLFRRYSSGLILNAYSGVFANGRLPLEVTLVSDSLNHFDTLYVIVLHMKANTGNDAEKLQSYYDRRDAGIALKNYLDQTRAGQKVAVIGDWNDRLTTSIWKDSITPYKNYLNDPANYFFTTLQRNQNGETTIATFSNSFIDHILISKRLQQQYEAGSATVFRLDNYITNYSNTTSDHFPVYTYFYFGMGVGMPEQANEPLIRVFPNPASDKICIRNEQKISLIELLDVAGKVYSFLIDPSVETELDVSGLARGAYFLRVKSETAVVVQKVILL